MDGGKERTCSPRTPPYGVVSLVVDAVHRQTRRRVRATPWSISTSVHKAAVSKNSREHSSHSPFGANTPTTAARMPTWCKYVFTGATASSHSSTLDVVLYTFRRYDSVVVVDIMVCVVSSCVVSSVCLVEDQECVRSLSFVRRGEGW